MRTLCSDGSLPAAAAVSRSRRPWRSRERGSVTPPAGLSSALATIARKSRGSAPDSGRCEIDLDL